MSTPGNEEEIEKNLEELDYPKNEDIFAQGDPISFDEDGNLNEDDTMEMNLDVPGSDLDNQQEEIGSEDEENNYYSTSDNNDNHEEINEDLIN